MLRHSAVTIHVLVAAAFAADFRTIPNELIVLSRVSLYQHIDADFKGSMFTGTNRATSNLVSWLALPPTDSKSTVWDPAPLENGSLLNFVYKTKGNKMIEHMEGVNVERRHNSLLEMRETT